VAARKLAKYHLIKANEKNGNQTNARKCAKAFAVGIKDVHNVYTIV